MIRPAMTEPKPESFLSLSPLSGFHRIAYMAWGEPKGRRATICVHGLTRQGRDFDHLASALATEGRFVVCPDVAGRGASDWLAEPSEYGLPTYVQDMAALIGRIGAERVDWVGTSMGGMIGMCLAAAPNAPIRRLVLNDIGPLVPKAALERISHYVGGAGGFASLDEVEQYLREIHAPFGNLTDAEWAHLAKYSASEDGPDRFALHYDPRIADPLTKSKEPLEDIDLWSVWERITCPVLVLRGESSDLLTPETAERMRTTGPEAEIVEIEGCGHAPALMDDHQVGLVAEWLAR